MHTQTKNTLIVVPHHHQRLILGNRHNTHPLSTTTHFPCLISGRRVKIGRCSRSRLCSSSLESLFSSSPSLTPTSPAGSESLSTPVVMIAAEVRIFITKKSRLYLSSGLQVVAVVLCVLIIPRSDSLSLDATTNINCQTAKRACFAEPRCDLALKFYTMHCDRQMFTESTCDGCRQAAHRLNGTVLGSQALTCDCGSHHPCILFKERADMCLHPDN